MSITDAPASPAPPQPPLTDPIDLVDVNGQNPDRPRNVIEAIRKVMLELPGIGKATGDQHRARNGQTSSNNSGRGGEQTIPYAYRSIEQITSEAQRLFGEYGVVFVPEVIPPPDPKLCEREFTQGTNGNRWTDTYLMVTYRIYGPGGPGDWITAGPVVGVGRDMSDKGFNKAMTQAFKQVLLQVLCIGDPKDEGEHDRHEQTGFRGQASESSVDQRPHYEQFGYVDEDEQRSIEDSLRGILAAINEPHKEPVKAWLIANGYTMTNDPNTARSFPIRKEHVDEYRQILIRARSASSEAAVAPDHDRVLPAPEPVDDRAPGDTTSDPSPAGDLAGEIPSHVPGNVIDEVIAEVRLLTGDGLREALKARKLPTTGNNAALGRRLTVARLNEWAEANPA